MAYADKFHSSKCKVERLGRCHHPAMDRTFSRPHCLLCQPSADARVPPGCRLYVERPEPYVPPAPPRK